MKKILLNSLMTAGLLTVLGVSSAIAQDSTTMPPVNPPKEDKKTEQPKSDDSKKQEMSPVGKYVFTKDKKTDSLELTADNNAVWSSGADGKEAVMVSGTWAITGDSLTVTIPAKEEGGQSATMTFKVSDKDLTLTSVTPEGLAAVGTKYKKGKS